VKIAVLHNLRFGGARRRLAEQVRRFDLPYVEITTSFADPVSDRPVVVPLDQRAESRHQLLRPPARYRDLTALAEVWQEMGDLAHRMGADVIYANPCSVNKSAVAILPRHLPVVRYCDEPRRVDYEPGLGQATRGSTRRLYAALYARQRALDRVGVGEAVTVLTNSRFTAASIQRAYGRAAVVTPCGVPDDMIDSPVGNRPLSHLLSVGSLIPTKGHELVVRAAARSGLSLPVVVVAPRSWAPEERRLREVAVTEGVQLKIVVGVSDRDLRRLYRGAVATMYLAQREPLGLVSLESQACGTPVIVADEGGLPETVRDGITGFCVPRDPQAAAYALAALAVPETRARMACAAREWASGWRWQVSADQVQEHLVEAWPRRAATRGGGPQLRRAETLPPAGAGPVAAWDVVLPRQASSSQAPVEGAVAIGQGSGAWDIDLTEGSSAQEEWAQEEWAR